MNPKNTSITESERIANIKKIEDIFLKSAIGHKVDAVRDYTNRMTNISNYAKEKDVQINIKEETIPIKDESLTEARTEGLTEVQIRDGFNNSVTMLGASDFLNNQNQIYYENLTLNWALWLALYGTSWTFKVAIDGISEYIVSGGKLKFSASDDKTLDVGIISKVQKKLKNLEDDLVNLVSMGRLFGGAVAVMLFDDIDESELSKPMKIEHLETSKKLKLFVTDRWYGLSWSMEKVTDIESPDYGKPLYYTVYMSQGTSVKVHHSWILRAGNRKPPRLHSVQLQGWDYAEGSHIFTELMREENLKNSVSSLINKALLEVVKMTGMKGLFSGIQNTASQKQIETRLDMVNRYRNNNSLIFLDQDDGYEQFQLTALAGLADLLDANKDSICGAIGASKLLLFGDTKGGLSGNSDTEWKWFDSKIQPQKRSIYRPILEKLLPVLFAMSGGNMEGIDFEFTSIIPRTTIDNLEVTDKFASVASSLISSGIWTPELAAKELKQLSEETGIGGSMDDTYINSLKNTIAEESEDLPDDDGDEE